MFWKRSKKPINTMGKLSPLDEIRQEEANAASQVLLARQEAESIKQAAQAQAAQTKLQAQLSGSLAGQAQYEIQIQEAIHESEQIRAEAQAHANAFSTTGKQNIHEAALIALQVVLGMEREEK